MFGLTKVIILSIALLFLLGCEERVKENKIKIGIVEWTGYDPIKIALTHDFFDDIKVEVITYPTIAEEKEAFESGLVDIACLTIPEVIESNERINDASVITILDISTGADVMVAKPYITNVKDLKGKTIALEENTLSKYILYRALQKAGLGLEDVSTIFIEYGEHQSTFSKRMIDAIITYEPTKHKLLSSGAKNIFDSSMLNREIIDVMVVRESIQLVKKEEIQKVVNGWYKSLEYMKEHNDASLSFLAKEMKVSKDEYTLVLEGLSIPDKTENKALLENSGEKIIEDYNRVSQYINKINLMYDGTNKIVFTDKFL